MTSRPARPGRRRVRSTRRRAAAPWWFTLPALLLFAFVVLLPSARGIYYAFTDWDGLDPDFAVVGPRNFTAMTDDTDALQAVWHTLLIAVAITVIQNLRGNLRGRRHHPRRGGPSTKVMRRTIRAGPASGTCPLHSQS
ncbi:hypothetical protein [Actinoplanes sp. NPDC049265]|uniref:hypothetical protein n=1 Tax=Actinoplanes sp. NPDC049265 TaxID=3363902 RepID=UPI0037235168